MSKIPRPIKIKFSNPINVSSELSKLVSAGTIDKVFADGLKSIIGDFFTGIIRGQKLNDSFIPLAKKYTGGHGVIQIGGSYYQLMPMVKEKPDSSRSHRWKLLQLHGEGYYAQELSSLPNP